MKSNLHDLLAALESLLVAAEGKLKSNKDKAANGENISLWDGVNAWDLAEAYLLVMNEDPVVEGGDREEYITKFEPLDTRFESIGELINPDGSRNEKDPRWLLSCPVL